MPAIIDSLFLELGIDTTKFSADQQRALAKIAEFEKQSKRSSSGAAEGVKTVGKAFKDLARESSVGSSAARLDTLATKIKILGAAASVSGGIGTPLGGVARGLGALLSPASLGIAAVGLLGAGMWDLNSKMTAANATMYRQAQLAGMGASNMWAWGEAAKDVGSNPIEVTGGIASLQTAIQGMGIGAGNASGQLIALSRLGVGYDFQKGANIPQLFEKVHQMAAARGYQDLGALRALTGPVMNDAMFNIAASPLFDPGKVQSQIKAMAGEKLGTTLKDSLQSQKVLGDLGIQKDVLAETAYGDEQGLLQAIVTILTSLLGVVNRIANFLHVPSIPPLLVHATDAVTSFAQNKFPGIFGDSIPSQTTQRQTYAANVLLKGGESADNTAAIIGNLMGESHMDPFATSDNGAHFGIAQWDRKRQADFAKQYGYQMGSVGVPALKQFFDQLNFLTTELKTTQSQAQRAMDAAPGVEGKTKAFMDIFERPGSADRSFLKRFNFAQAAEYAVDSIFSSMNMVAAGSAGNSMIANTVTHHTRIGDINVNSSAPNGRDMASDIRADLNAHPLLGPLAQQTIILATRGMQN